MYDAMSGYEVPPSVNYVSPSSYYGDPTRVFDSSEGEEIIGSYIFVVSKIYKIKLNLLLYDSVTIRIIMFMKYACEYDFYINLYISMQAQRT